MKPLWLGNLKQFVTGTAVAAKQCMDVNVANSVTISTTFATLAYKERRFHDAALTNINASGGAWIQLDVAGAATPADIANTCTELDVNWNGGNALEVGVGANSGAVSVICAFGAGQTRGIGVSLAAGDKVWVRCVQNASCTAGELMIVLLG